MFGTRATAVVDLTFAATLLAPLVTLLSLRAARRRNYQLHRWLQVGLAVVCFATVIALETQIRLAGGSGAFLGERGGGARLLLGVHISGAVLTYLAWAWLAVVSWRRYTAALPGPFSRRHKLLGKCIFAGLCFTALTAAGMYTLAFV